MKTFIKWAGGKEKELPIIMNNLPEHYDRYVEPFVGGGAVFLNINCKKNIVNDKSDELMLLYKMIKTKNEDFINSLNDINKNWIRIEKIVTDNSKELIDIYLKYKKKQEYLEKMVDDFLDKHKKELNKLLRDEVDINLYNLIIEIKKNLISKISRMYKIEKSRNEMPESDIQDNLETAFKSAYYMYFRYLYNNKKKLKLSNEFYCAVFYFVRDYCYASMFRYNANGEFNVPYGGISYNRKDFKKKIEYLSSKELRDYLSKTDIYNLDFEDFCNKVSLNENDFMFLDPPYDTEFSTYAKNDFGKEDQIRLANYLKKTKAKFMLVIKNTEFIYNLYKDSGFNIKSFDKKYLVSFMNRNDKDVEHLLITNY
jgi:DNA adenine methylase